MHFRDNLLELCVYESNIGDDFVNLNGIREMWMKCPAVVAYITDNKKRLVGVVSRSEVYNNRNGENVKINKSFTYIVGKNAVKARRVFKTMQSIDKIPVIDMNGVLLGDYTRWDNEPIYLSYICEDKIAWGKIKAFLNALHIKQVIIVRPNNEILWIVEYIISVFEHNDIMYITIDKSNIETLSIETKSLMVFASVDEKLSCDCIFGDVTGWDTISKLDFVELYNRLNCFVNSKKLEDFGLKARDGIPKPLRDLMNNGIGIIGLYNRAFGIEPDDYWISFARDNHRYKKVYNIQRNEFWPRETEMYKDFFGDLLNDPDYILGIAQKQIIDGHTAHGLNKDFTSTYYNVINGNRRTCYQPQTYQNSIYFFGQCIIMGAYKEDKYTIDSILQKKLIETGYQYCVENRGRYGSVYDSISEVEFKKGDVIVVWTGDEFIPGIESINIQDICEKYHAKAYQFLGSLVHHNHEVSEYIASELYGLMIDKGIICIDKTEDASVSELAQLRIDDYDDLVGAYINSVYLSRYFISKEFSNYNNTGCIVVYPDISPISIENAVRVAENICDALIIFIPENFRTRCSLYSTSEYIIETIRMTVHSGIYIRIVMGETFVPYISFFWSFDVAVSRIDPIEARKDIQVFSQCIASRLNIQTRFGIGSDLSEKMRDYNEILLRELPKYGIKYIES